MAFTPEKAGWSAAPEATQELARQKAICDEGAAQIRAGYQEEAYAYWFGRMESMWRYILAVSRKGSEAAKKQAEEGGKTKEALWGKILAFVTLRNEPQEAMPIFENEKRIKLMALKSDVISLFDSFYQSIIFLGVDCDLLSFQKGGDYKLPQYQRIRGIPTVNE
jgi:hypothetical protein